MGRLGTAASEHGLSARASMGPLSAELRAQSRDMFVAVGEISDTIENLATRMNTWAAQLPRHARWQAELLALDVAEEREVQNVLGAAEALGTAARQASGVLGDVPGLVATSGTTMGQFVTAERRAALADADRQRIATLEYVTSERLAVLAALREERVASSEFFRQERIEGLNETTPSRPGAWTPPLPVSRRS